MKEKKGILCLTCLEGDKVEIIQDGNESNKIEIFIKETNRNKSRFCVRAPEYKIDRIKKADIND